MLVGVIKNRDVFLHPISVFRIRGVIGFFKLFLHSLTRKPYRFLDILDGRP